MLKDASGFKHIYIACGKTDLRKGIDGMLGVIVKEFALNPFDAGNTFLFCGTKGSLIKALVMEDDGFVLLTKRLQKGMSILINQKFGRKTEKLSEIVNGQMFFDFKGNVFETSDAEPDILVDDLKNAVTEIEECVIDEDKLDELFPDGYTELPYDKGHRVEYAPSELTVIEEHIHIYKSKKGGEIVRADRPEHLLAHSILTPSPAAGITTGKFVNATPINRTAEDFKRKDITIRPQTMDRWVISISEGFVSPIVQRMKQSMINETQLIHCDETPLVVEEDRKTKGGSKSSNSFIWVYHTSARYGCHNIYIYEYQPDRKGYHTAEFLDGFNGIIMTDGYEPYHKVGRESDGKIIVAGCWVHLKRKFSDVIKTMPDSGRGTVAYEGVRRIAAIYQVDNMMKKAPPDERLEHRKKNVVPLVDAFFEWVKEKDGTVATEGTQKGLDYAISQEHYLRAFLSSGIIPLDNNNAEQSIKKFVVGRKNWTLCATSRGAKAAATMCSIFETLKANNIKPFQYMEYMLRTMRHYENNITVSLIDSLLPWSDKLPPELRMKVN